MGLLAAMYHTLCFVRCLLHQLLLAEWPRSSITVAGIIFLRNLEKHWTMHAAAARIRRFSCAVARPATISHCSSSSVTIWQLCWALSSRDLCLFCQQLEAPASFWWLSHGQGIWRPSWYVCLVAGWLCTGINVAQLNLNYFTADHDIETMEVLSLVAVVT